MRELRTCFWCKYFEYSEGWGGTDVTPGDPPYISCQKNVFPAKSGPDFLGMRELTRIATNCRKFELAEEIKRMQLQESVTA